MIEAVLRHDTDAEIDRAYVYSHDRLRLHLPPPGSCSVFSSCRG